MKEEDQYPQCYTFVCTEENEQIAKMQKIYSEPGRFKKESYSDCKKNIISIRNNWFRQKRIFPINVLL